MYVDSAEGCIEALEVGHHSVGSPGLRQVLRRSLQALGNLCCSRVGLPLE